MNKKLTFILLTASLLTGCARTNELYKVTDYNDSIFDNNYYTEYAGFDRKNYEKVCISSTFSTTSENYQTYAEGKNLGLVDNAFNKGILSKLYDGRSWCNRLFQKSRVQVDKSGFGARFPLKLQSAEKFEFISRGGTSPEHSIINASYYGDLILHYNFEISLYTETTQIIYSLNDVPIYTDSHNKTTVVSFNLGEEARDIVGFSMKYECVDIPGNNTTDDMNDKEKDHLALMLYEVLLPGSTWIK